MGAKLLQDVRQDLADVVQVCEGKKKQTNYLRTLINELVKGAEMGRVCGWELGAEALTVVCASGPSTPYLQAPGHGSLSGFLSSGRVLDMPVVFCDFEG